MLSRIMSVLLLVLAVATPHPAEAKQLGSVMREQLTLERELTAAINAALDHLVGSRHAFATVSVDMEAQLISKTTAKGGARAMSFTVGTVSSQKYLKLPGLPRMRPGKLTEPVRIRIDPKKRKETSTQVVGVVTRVRVRLYVDPKLPPPRLAAVQQAVRDTVGLQKERGDTLKTIRMVVTHSTPVAVALKPSKQVDWLGMGAIPLSIVLAALILGLFLRTGRAGDGTSGEEGAAWSGRAAEGGVLEGALLPAGPAAEATVAQHERGARYLPALAEVDVDELMGLIEQLAAKDAELVLALAPVPAGRLARVVDRLAEDPGRAKLVAGLAKQRQVKVAQLDGLAKRVDEALERVRNPEAIAVGAPERLGQILRGSSRRAARAVLASLEGDAELSAAVRKTLVQFEDLPELPAGVLRRVVATVDPTVLATALVGADARVVEAVQGVLSGRLERILREEQQALGKDTPEDAVEQAREQMQQALNQLTRDAAHA